METARDLGEVEVVAQPNARGMPRNEPVSFLATSPRVALDTVEFRVVLTVPDFDEAVAFYRDALGLEQLADWSGENGRVILLDAGRATLELFDERQAESVDRIEAGSRVSGPVRLAIEVEDLDGTARRLVTGGAAAEADPVVPPWGGRNARLRAPDGMQLTLFSEE
jgi:lactoylglutathione lyase